MTKWSLRIFFKILHGVHHFLKKTIYQLCSTSLMECFDDGAVILNLETYKLIELNTTARDILQATNGQNEINEVVEHLGGVYEISIHEARMDVDNLYQQLLEQGIIEIVNINDH